MLLVDKNKYAMIPILNKKKFGLVGEINLAEILSLSLSLSLTHTHTNKQIYTNREKVRDSLSEE